ncbi:amidohydrolase 2 [Trichodelitschia bisporula]|uniref:Amidohydrolase 2 n=1 Tax=Trichodelitschia bisporula TaxID=703511 RepID=A0A6G1HK54_9PEZI|nr:amidohydrolase 2 [Trichodelitschia bisporula]
MASMIPLITLEEHFFSTAIGTPQTYAEMYKHLPGVEDKLHDVSDLRLAEMAKGAVTKQVISHAPGMGALSPSDCSSANDELAASVRKLPSRFAGFAVLSLRDPEAAAAELRRCVTELGFVGALIDNHVEGVHYEGSAFKPIWAAAQDLDVPIYLHPVFPTREMQTRYAGEISVGAASSLGTSAWGWHSETGLHVLKLFAAGVFDEFPRLKIIVGHFGEMLPFMLGRVVRLSQRWGPRERLFREVYRENIWVTTSGASSDWGVDAMGTILRNTKMDHILYSVDYPFAKNEDGLTFMEELRESGLVTEEEFKDIGYRNAEKLLRITVD